MEIESDTQRAAYNTAKIHYYHTKATLSYRHRDCEIYNILRCLDCAIARWKLASLDHLFACENQPALGITKWAFYTIVAWPNNLSNNCLYATAFTMRTCLP